ERQRLPNLSLTAESDTGNSRSSANTTLQVEQTVWDFGQLNARIAGAKTEAVNSQLRVNLQMQDVALQIIGAWQTLLAAQQRLNAATHTLERLQAFVQQMERRVAAELSAPIDLELVQARVLQTQVEFASAQNSKNLAIHRLEQLSGIKGLAAQISLPPLNASLLQAKEFVRELQSMDLNQQAGNSPVVTKARLDAERAKYDHEAVKAQNFPTVYVRSNQPLTKQASGFEINTGMTTFLGLRYSPGAGFATASQTEAMQIRMNSAQEKIQSAIQEMEQLLRSDREEAINAEIRIQALESSVHGSDRVLQSYKDQYVANRKSWLDLMNAVRELAQNEYALADTQASLLGAMWRLQVRLGRTAH
ncbi:MAG: hypothetical protein RL307_124, partial [Pseudomonadota bacterium]